MDWLLLFLGIVFIAYIAVLIAIPIICCGYYCRDFPPFVTMMVNIAFYLTLIWFALVVGHADVLLPICLGAIFMSHLVSTDSKRSQKGYSSYSSSMKACGCLLLLIYAIAIIMLTFAIGWGVLAAIGLVFFGLIPIILAGAGLGKKFDTFSRLENIGSGIRKNKELQIVNNHRMIEFKANLIQWQVEGYSELKGVMGIKNFDQMEGKFNEVKQKIERLKAVESTLNKLSQDFLNERAVFELEMESIRKKYKDLSKVNEVEREIKNLKSELTKYHELKNEILDRIAEVA